MKPYKRRIGYACMNEDIRPNVYQTCRKSNITETRLRSIITQNLQVLEATIDYNIKHGNHMFRVSSSLIPFGSSPLNTVHWAIEFKDVFERIKTKIEAHDIRISVHPGQYTVINSPDSQVVEQSIAELEYHAQILELLSGNPNHKMILHVGGIYGDKEAAIRRFISVYQTQLSARVRKYLVIENDDRLYTVADTLNISEVIGIPVVFDNLHHLCNPSLQDKTLVEIINAVVETWDLTQGNPKFHYSQQAIDKRMGAHSDTIDLEKFRIDFETYYAFVPVDIMLEVKDKNRSFIKVDQWLEPSQRVMEQEWARYKYWVMARSQTSYNALRLLFKNNNKVDPRIFYGAIDALRGCEEDVGSHVNALQHVWGYFKKTATQKEKERFMALLKAYREGESQLRTVVAFLEKQAVKYECHYLLESYFFDVIR